MTVDFLNKVQVAISAASSTVTLPIASDLSAADFDVVADVLSSEFIKFSVNGMSVEDSRAALMQEHGFVGVAAAT